MWFFRRKKQKKRKVFGFLCDPNLALSVKLMAKHLETPIYPVAEHLLQLGMKEMVAILHDEALKEELQRHLLQEHLLVTELNEQSEPVSRRALRVQNALKFLRLYEHSGLSLQQIKQALDELEKKQNRHGLS